MPKLGAVEDTLFVPMLGRIYASERFPGILYDKKALELKAKLPSEIFEQNRQGQYTLIASAARSANMDRYVRDFLKHHEDGAVVQLGCGLETAFFRNDNGKARWYAVDLPDVIEYRRTLLPEPERETYIAGNAFETAWIERIRAELPDAPLLLTASGLFYYFQEADVLALFHMLRRYGKIEIVFDVVSKAGLAMMRAKYMKDAGAGAEIFFSVDSAQELVKKAHGAAEVVSEEAYYCKINRKGLRFSTRMSMNVSDMLRMVKMVHLRINAFA